VTRPAALVHPSTGPASRLGPRFPSPDARRTFVQLLPLLGLFLLVSALTDPGKAAGDEAPLLAAAHRLLEGSYAVAGTTDSSMFLWHGPGLPALLAPLVALGVPLSGLRLTSPLLMFASVLMFHRLLALRLSRRGALIGAYALALYAPAYYVIGTIAKEPLALFLAIAALDGTARYLEYGRVRHAVIAGVCLGWLAMTRLEYGWVIVAGLIAGLVWWPLARLRSRGPATTTRSARRWALICGLAFLVCLPWLTYSYGLTHHILYWGNSGGISLYWMSSPSPHQLGEWHAYHSVMSDPALAGYRAFFEHLGSRGPVGSDLELQHLAVVQAVGHPAKYALNLLANLGRMFAGFPFSFTLPLAVVIGLILINGTLLGGLGWAARRLVRLRPGLPPETLPFLLYAGLAFGVHLLPSSEPRMMIPIVPVAIWLIVLAAERQGSGSECAAQRGGRRAQRRIAGLDPGLAPGRSAALAAPDRVPLRADYVARIGGR
jgi:hypothetical protein